MRILAIALVPLALAACGGSDDSAAPSEQAVTTLPTGSTEPSTAPVDGTTPSTPVVESDQVSATGVVLASVLLLEGDVEQAIADGLVTPAEVDAAVAAIEAGTLDEWVALAGE
jgi:hypothetical protein